MSITLCMIVKNEEKHLRGCFESVKDLVNQIVVVDTGSTDSTIQIAKEFSADVFEFEWIKDFSAARNFALSKSTGNWILYLDADERLSPDSIDEIKTIIKTNEFIGVNCFVKSPDDESARENVICYPRLFRNSDKIKFSGSVHEQIIESLTDNNYKIIKSSIEILHLGYNVSKDKKREKAERNLELLLNDYAANPTTYTAFQLAQTYNVLERFDEAGKFFNGLIHNKKVGKEIQLLSYYNIASEELRNHNLDASLRHSIEGLKLDNEYPLLNYLLSKICLRMGDLNQAIKLCKKVYIKNLSVLKNKSFTNNDIVLNSEELLLYGLNISRQAGSNDSLNYFLTEYAKPSYKNFINNGFGKSSVVKKILSKNNIEEEEIALLEGIAATGNIEYLVPILSVYTILSIKIKILEKLKQKFPNDCTIASAYGVSLLEAGKTEQSIQQLEHLLNHPDVQPSVAFYLISIYINDGRYDEITRLIEYSESRFNMIPEAKAAIELIKHKLEGLPLTA